MHYKGFYIEESTRHGKAVAGTKKTSSIQIQQELGNGYLCLKSISFPVDNCYARKEAIEKAKKLIDSGKIKTLKA